MSVAAPRPIDELGRKLVETGLAASDYVLDLNRKLTTPYDMEMPWPWTLPSRAFRFPIATKIGGDGKRTLSLMHPLLKDHPFVKRVEEVLGPDCWTSEPQPADVAQAEFWHGIDMIDAKKPRELLKTRDFTTADAIANGVRFGLNHRNGISLADAKTVLRAIGAEDPQDRGATLAVFSEPRSCSSEKGVIDWPVNDARQYSNADKAWARVIGLECGWFHYRGSYIGWTEAGRARFAAGPDATTLDEEAGQIGFAF